MFRSYFRWITVRSVAFRAQFDHISGHQIFDHMAAAVIKLAGVNTVERIILGHFRRADVAIHSGNAP